MTYIFGDKERRRQIDSMKRHHRDATLYQAVCITLGAAFTLYAVLVWITEGVLMAILKTIVFYGIIVFLFIYLSRWKKKQLVKIRDLEK